MSYKIYHSISNYNLLSFFDIIVFLILLIILESLLYNINNTWYTINNVLRFQMHVVDCTIYTESFILVMGNSSPSTSNLAAQYTTTFRSVGHKEIS